MARAARVDRSDRTEGTARRSPMEERIIASAVALFAEQGFDATTVQQVVDRAQVTKGALYHYFDSKDDLLYEIYHALIGVQNVELDATVAQGLDPATTVRQILIGVFRSTAQRLEHAVVFFRDSHRLNAERQQAYRADRRHFHETFRQVIENAQASGVFSTAVPAETVVLTAMGVVNQLPLWYRPDGPKTAEQLADEVADLILGGLLAK